MAKISNAMGPSNAVTGEGMPHPDGYVQAAPPAADESAPNDNPAVPSDAEIERGATFDPSTRTAEEVAARISDLRAKGDDDGAQRVIDDEKAGKSRTTALKGA